MNVNNSTVKEINIFHNVRMYNIQATVVNGQVKHYVVYRLKFGEHEYKYPEVYRGLPISGMYWPEQDAWVIDEITGIIDAYEDDTDYASE